MLNEKYLTNEWRKLFGNTKSTVAKDWVDQRMTINGVKKILNNKDPLKLDETVNDSIKSKNLKNKLVKISNIVKSLKKLK